MASKQKVVIPTKKRQAILMPKNDRVFGPGAQVAVTTIPSKVEGNFLLQISGLPSSSRTNFHCAFVDLSKKSNGKVYKGYVNFTSGYNGTVNAVITPSPPIKHSVGNIMFMHQSNDVVILWIVIIVIIMLYVQ
jgi:ribosomal protein L35AE/L33A